MSQLHPQKANFTTGLRHGIPIALGYFVVAFTYGMMATLNGLSPYETVLISMTSLTSAGQFAGTNIMLAGGSYMELFLSMLVINSRYALMSASISQKLAPMPLWKKLVLSAGLTDETFSVASVEVEKVTFAYFIGLVTLPYMGWALGTGLGSVTDNILTVPMQNAASIALYCMFIALVLPPAKHQAPVRKLVILTIIISCLMVYLPLFSSLSSGYKIIISAIISSLIAALIYPIQEVESR